MRVLVITRAPWRNDNNTGNTLTNFFGQAQDVEFWNLYFRDQSPQNDIATKSFSISEAQLVRNLLRGTPVGRLVDAEKAVESSHEETVYKQAKNISGTLLMLVREVLWKVSRWKSDNLKDFLGKEKIDIIYMPVFNCFYPHRVLQFVQEQTGAKIVLFHADDNYTLKQYSLSPLYWLYRLNLRKWVRRSVARSSLNYAISNMQKEEYEKSLNKPFKLLTKGADFEGTPPVKSHYNSPLQIVFTGNVGMNRWKSLSLIADALEEINKDGVLAQLRIYTATSITRKMHRALHRGESSYIMGKIPASEVSKIQENADMLVHVEAFDLKNKLSIRQSFSTKLVDYFAAARPVLAIGPKNVASIDHLIKNACAIVADSKEELTEKLQAVLGNKEALDRLAKQAYHCGRTHHNKEITQQMLMHDIHQIGKKH